MAAARARAVNDRTHVYVKYIFWGTRLRFWKLKDNLESGVGHFKMRKHLQLVPWYLFCKSPEATVCVTFFCVSPPIPVMGEGPRKKK